MKTVMLTKADARICKLLKGGERIELMERVGGELVLRGYLDPAADAAAKPAPKPKPKPKAKAKPAAKSKAAAKGKAKPSATGAAFADRMKAARAKARRSK